MFKFETTAETMEELAEKLFRASGRVAETAAAGVPSSISRGATDTFPRGKAMETPTSATAAPSVAPVPTHAQTAPVVPVAPAPGYTAEQVGKAGADLIAADPGKMGELLGLLGQFGVQAITELTPDKLGPFATSLRVLGAKI